MKAMEQFERFLQEVKNQNPDEFQELNDILSRYQTLKSSNDKLQEANNLMTRELDKMNKQIAQYTKDMGSEKMTLNNRIAVQQQSLEELEDQKGRLMAESEENTSNKMKKTREHGQILMTIENLYRKCKQRKELQTMAESKKTDSPKNFDNTKLRAENAVQQLIIINQTIQKFATLRQVLDKQDKIKVGRQKKIENFEIV